MDGSEDGWTGRTDGLSMAQTDSATDLRGDRQMGELVGGWTDWLHDRLTGRRTDGSCDRHTDDWVGEGARWGCKATYSLLMVGGPLDWCKRGLGSVESRRCNWATRKSCLGVSRRSYRSGYTP